MNVYRSTFRDPKGQYLPKPREYWADWENAERELQAWMDEYGAPLSRAALKQTGNNHLTYVVNAYGGYSAVMRKLGLDRKGQYFWFSHVRYELEKIIKRRVYLPDPSSGSLDHVLPAIRKYHGGWSAVCEKIGYGPVTADSLRRHAESLVHILQKLQKSHPRLLSDDLWLVLRKRENDGNLKTAIRLFDETADVEHFSELILEEYMEQSERRITLHIRALKKRRGVARLSPSEYGREEWRIYRAMREESRLTRLE